MEIVIPDQPSLVPAREHWWSLLDGSWQTGKMGIMLKDYI
jgi:hypothetical protein